MNGAKSLVDVGHRDFRIGPVELQGEVGWTFPHGNIDRRAVRLEAGSHRVRYKYTPMSLKLGLYGTFMAAVVGLLLLAFWLWGRFYRESDEDSTVKRVAKNSLIPMGLQLLNKVIDFAFAMLMLRILAPEMAGRYQFAVTFIGYFDILVRFGLGTLLTREVSKDREQANRLLGTTTVLRGLLWAGSLPLMALSLIHISEPTRLLSISYAVFCLKKKKYKTLAELTVNSENDS